VVDTHSLVDERSRRSQVPGPTSVVARAGADDLTTHPFNTAVAPQAFRHVGGGDTVAQNGSGLAGRSVWPIR